MKRPCKISSQWKNVLLIVILSFYGLLSSSAFSGGLATISKTSSFLSTTASTPVSTATNKVEFPFSSGETLYYKLSYRGLLTSMIWADLADVKMTYLSNRKTPNNQNAYQFKLFLSTENYMKAEMFQPVRYTYTTTLDASSQRTVLVEQVDAGKKQSHKFLWLDWKNKETQLFKKREKEQQTYGFLGMDVRESWEKDGTQPVPEFLGDYPLLEDKQTYLIHKESGDKIERPQILDPLSLIYILRTLDFATHSEAVKEIAVAISDDIRLYHVSKIVLEKLSINGELHQGIKYKIQTDEKKDRHYYVWLSNDEKKIPLRLAMDTPLGKLEIDLMKVTRKEKN